MKQKRNKTRCLCRKNSNIIKSETASDTGCETEDPLRLNDDLFILRHDMELEAIQYNTTLYIPPFY